MIIVASNWAIGDGTLVSAAPSSIGGLAATMHRAAIRAGVGTDGGYRPIERLDVVLAGDTFEWLVSAEWLGDTKPWHASARSLDRLARVARRSIRLGRAVLAPLAAWARRGLPVPTSMSRGGRRCSVAVPVRVTLLAGDRDAAVERVLGGRRAVTVGRRWDDGRVSIRHGHDRDPVCRAVSGRADSDRPPTLAESVAVDLVARFAAPLAGRGPRVAGQLRRLAEAGVVGIPAVMAGWQGAIEGGAEEVGLRDAWSRSVEGWWREARRCVPTCEVEFDAVDALASWLATAMRPGAEVCPIAAGLAAVVAAPSRGGPGVVEGHSGGVGLHGALGLAGGEPGVGPPLAACVNDRGWPRWQLIAAGVDATPIVAIRPQAVPAHPDRRVVDAA
jgi:hypothetical protein